MPTKTYPDETVSTAHPDTPVGNTSTDVTLRENRIALRSRTAIDAGEAVIHRWLIRYSITVLRVSMGAVLLGYGFLKYFPGVSPVESLVLATMHLLSFGLVPAVVSPGLAMALVATLECTIGLLLISGRWLRLAICLLAIQLAGILSPTILLAGRMFAGPHHMPTLEGQYVLKDVILVAAAMVIATTVRGGALTDGGHPSPKNK
jgi:putative oxidoreductase